MRADMRDHLPVRGSIRNKLIAGLAVKDFNRIRPHLERVTLPQHERLLRPRARTEYAYFPESGMVSLILSLEEGHVVEVGLVGNEGCLLDWALAGFLGRQSSRCPDQV